MTFCVPSFKKHKNLKYTPNDFFQHDAKRKKLHLCRTTEYLSFLDSQGLTDQNYAITISPPPHFTEINWELYDILLKFGRKHSARISSAYVLTFDVVENSKKKAWEPQAVLLWPETHLELSSLATLMLGIIGRDRIAEEMK